MINRVFYLALLLPFLMAFDSSYVKTGGEPEVVSIKATDTAMIFTVTTQSYGGDYAPKHCLAIWITDNNNVFKRTLKLAAQTYKMHLVKWNQMSGGNVTDAITGASLTSHTTHTIVWDGKDKNGTLQPDGQYKVYIEFTEENSLSTNIPDGPWTSFTFTKGINQTQQPSDVTFTYNGQTKTVYKNIVVQTFGASTIQDLLNGGNISIYPNPVSHEAQIRISLNKPLNLNVAVYDITGRVVHQYPIAQYSEGEHIFFWYPKRENLQAGTYFVKVSVGSKSMTFKLIVE